MIRVLLVLAGFGLAGCSQSAPASDAGTPINEAAPAAQPSLLSPAAGETAATTSLGDPAPAEAPADAAEAAKPVPAELPEAVARVNGEVISATELQEAIGQLEARAGQPVPADRRDAVFRGVLDQMIGYRLLVQESAARTIAIDDAEIDARVAELRQQFPSEEAFEQVLAQRGITLAELRTDLRESLRIDRLIEAELAGKVAVTPEQVAAFYQQNPSEFQQGERVRASHILIAAPETADAAARDEARARAAQVLEQVKAGEAFDALARQHSQDPGSAANGGDLGYFERGQMVPPFEEAAFSLQPNQTSGLVETPFGYHIIRVAERQAARTVPLDEVRPQIQQFLEGQTREQQLQAFVASLRTKGRIEILI